MRKAMRRALTSRLYLSILPAHLATDIPPLYGQQPPLSQAGARPAQPPPVLRDGPADAPLPPQRSWAEQHSTTRLYTAKLLIEPARPIVI